MSATNKHSWNKPLSESPRKPTHAATSDENGGKPLVTTPVQRYLGVPGTATYLSMTEGAVYAAVARRQIPFRRWGSKLRFDVLELDALMRRVTGVNVGEAVARRTNKGTPGGCREEDER